MKQHKHALRDVKNYNRGFNNERFQKNKQRECLQRSDY